MKPFLRGKEPYFPTFLKPGAFGSDTCKIVTMLTILMVMGLKFGKFWLVVGGYGWLWVVVAGFGWLWVVVAGCGWLWVVVGRVVHVN